jgi:hypothetical protein
MAGFDNVTASLRKTEAELQRQLDAVRAAIAALGASGGRRGRPAGTGAKGAAGAGRKRRRLSPAARKRISDAQKLRWARQRGDKK